MTLLAKFIDFLQMKNLVKNLVITMREIQASYRHSLQHHLRKSLNCPTGRTRRKLKEEEEGRTRSCRLSSFYAGSSPLSQGPFLRKIDSFFKKNSEILIFFYLKKKKFFRIFEVFCEFFLLFFLVFFSKFFFSFFSIFLIFRAFFFGL